MRKLFIYLMAVVGFMLMITSCQYKFKIEPVIPPPDPEESLSFSEDVVPIWNNENKCTQCHNTGGTAPDLTADNAYNSIINSYVDVNDPEASIIYSKLYPDTDPHSWRKYTASEAAIILQWITQGALDN